MLDHVLAGIDSALLARVADRLAGLEPDTVALLATGSYAKGTATADSDLDLHALTSAAPRERYRRWFEARPDGPPLHVSAGAKTVDDWLAASAEPARWSLGFAARNDAVYLWAEPNVRERLGESPTNVHPPGAAELEDVVEALAKVGRAAAAGDDLGARWHAQAAALAAPRLLLGVNPERVVGDRRDALDAALSLPVAPAGWRADLATCLGLTETDDDGVTAAAARLGLGLLAFLREHDPDVDEQPGVADALRSGALERALARSGAR